MSENNCKDNSNLITKSKINSSKSEQDQRTGPGPNKPPKQEDNNTIKSPIFPHTPVKVYENAAISKKDIVKDFKEVPLIYM